MANDFVSYTFPVRTLVPIAKTLPTTASSTIAGFFELHRTWTTFKSIQELQKASHAWVAYCYRMVLESHNDAECFASDCSHTWPSHGKEVLHCSSAEPGLL